MNVILFPRPTIRLTSEENQRFEVLKDRLRNSITPGEARHYKNELDFLVELGKSRLK